MSVEAISWALEHSTAKGGARLVLLALADHAHHDGSNAYPSVATLARKARLSERAVQYALESLRAAGEIEPTGLTAHGVVIYRIAIGGGAKAAPPGAKRDTRGVQTATTEGAQIAPKPSLTEPSIVEPPSQARECASGDHEETAWALTASVLAECNRQLGTDFPVATNTGEPSNAADLIHEQVRRHPHLTAEDHRRIIANTLASRWWGESAPTVNVIYGRRVFENNIHRPSDDAGRHMSASAMLRALIDAEAFEETS